MSVAVVLVVVVMGLQLSWTDGCMGGGGDWWGVVKVVRVMRDVESSVDACHNPTTTARIRHNHTVHAHKHVHTHTPENEFDPLVT